MIVAVLAGVSMFIADIFQALYVIELAKGKAALAGMFDGLSDVAGVISIGGGASTVYHHSLDLVTAAALILILLGSIGGAYVGNRLSCRITGRPVK